MWEMGKDMGRRFSRRVIFTLSSGKAGETGRRAGWDDATEDSWGDMQSRVDFCLGRHHHGFNVRGGRRPAENGSVFIHMS